MVCYKFTSAQNGFLTLFDRRLKASRPNEFNDTFEYCPASDPQSLVRKIVADPTEVRKAYEREVTLAGYPGSLQDFVARDFPQILKSLMPQTCLTQKDLSARDDASKYMGVVCLSRCCLVYLLWSHYADSHRGCALGIDVRHNCFCRARLNGNVVYANQRPVWDWCAEGEAFNRKMIDTIRTKSDVWAYEREYRLSFAIEELQIEGLHYFVLLHPQAVRRVIYGERINPEFHRRVESVLRHPDFAHVRRFRVKRHPRKYSLLLERLTPGSFSP